MRVYLHRRQPRYDLVFRSTGTGFAGFSPDPILNANKSMNKWIPTVLFNYGSLDLFTDVDLGLASHKRGRSPAMLRRERSILNQVQLRSILRLILPEMVAQNQIKRELQEKMSPLSTSPPHQKVLRRQFPCFALSNHHYYHIRRQQGPKHSPNCVVQVAYS